MIPKLRTWKKYDSPEMFRDIAFIDFNKKLLGVNYKVSKLTTRLDIETLDKFILMQSTGIKDKNGVEIYEGDILKLNAIFLAPDDSTEIGRAVQQLILAPDDKIGYLEYYPKYGYSIIFEGNRLYRQEFWASTNKLNYEVIGNIYENPELLEGDKK